MHKVPRALVTGVFLVGSASGALAADSREARLVVGAEVVASCSVGTATNGSALRVRCTRGATPALRQASSSSRPEPITLQPSGAGTVGASVPLALRTGGTQVVILF